jgi:glycosyltransferase involved in cell wall biosynthesis
MRVAVVHDFHHRSEPSGEDVVVAAEVAALRRAGVEVELAGADNDREAQRVGARLRGAFITTTGIGRKPVTGPTDLVHVHNVFPYVPTRWLEDVDVPVVATLHSYRAMCATGFLYRDGAVCTDCPDGDPWAGVRHGCYRSRLATVPLAIAGRRGAGRDRVLHRCDRILALSERSRDLFVGAGVDPGRIVLDHHFLPDAAVPDELSDGDGPWVVLSRLSEEKGVSAMVTAWPGDVPLQVIGAGPDAHAVAAAAAGKQVQVVGTLPRADALRALARARGVVVPSRWYETFGLVHMEALSAGVPTLAFEPNVIADAVRREGTGLVGSLATLVDDLVDAERRFPSLRQHCRAVFEREHTEAGFIRRRLPLYDALIAAGRGA